MSEQSIELPHVEAFYHAASWAFVSYGTGFARFHSLLAGQMSSFAVSSPANPAIRSVELQVTSGLGSPLAITGQTLVDCTLSS